MGKRMTRTIRVALSVTGSAILLFSCADKDAGRASASEETMMTEYSEDLSVVMSQNGRRSYHFVTPLLEGYSLAREPYREFRKGVKITTYQNDSLTTVDAVLTANYAIYYENRELWEAKGNVRGHNAGGEILRIIAVLLHPFLFVGEAGHAKIRSCSLVAINRIKIYIFN